LIRLTNELDAEHNKQKTLQPFKKLSKDMKEQPDGHHTHTPHHHHNYAHDDFNHTRGAGTATPKTVLKGQKGESNL